MDALSFSTEGSRRNTSVGSEGLTDKIGPLARAKAVCALGVRPRLRSLFNLRSLAEALRSLESSRSDSDPATVYVRHGVV